MDVGPKAISGDLNGPLEAFPTILEMIKDQGWTDVGGHEAICKGKPYQATCHTNESAAESRIDYFIANEQLTPAITHCEVDPSSDYPTHRPLCIDISTNDLKKKTKQLIKPTDMAEMMEERILKELKSDQDKREEIIKQMREGESEPKEVHECDVRKRCLEELQVLMDHQIEKRHHRFELAIHTRNVQRMWDLIAAAFEEANILFHGLKEVQAKKARGRSRITYQKAEKDPLK